MGQDASARTLRRSSRRIDARLALAPRFALARPHPMMPPLLATTVVGSYPQPEWLVDRELLRSRLVPRLAASEIWRVPEPYLEEAKNDATVLAIRDMERAGHRHHHGRRDQARELFQSFRLGARRGGRRKSRRGRGPHGREDLGAARRRPDPSLASDRACRCAISHSQHRSRHQGHVARPLHPVPASDERALCG